jgi:pheromone alpha factor receptor
MVALLLPLSSLWASMAINNEAASLDISRLSGYNMRISNNSNSTNSTSSCNHCGHCRKLGMPSTRHTEYSDEEKGQRHGLLGATTIKNEINCGTPREISGRDSTETDLRAMGVRVDKSYSLQSGKEDDVLGREE